MSDDATRFERGDKDKKGPDPVPRVPYSLEIKNLELLVPEGETIAPGWTPWVAEDNDFGAVEFLPMEFEGERRQGFFGQGRYDAAVWQHAEVEAAGLSVNITMDFQIMSHDTDRDRPAGLIVGLGIDPYGGQDARSNTVQWSLTDLPYDTLVSASVTAVAQSKVVTVFVRSIAFLPGSHTITGNGNKLVCLTGFCAREAYDRVYILLPPTAPVATWQKAAIVAGDPTTHWTVGGSADDAGLGGRLLGQDVPQTQGHKPPVVIGIDPLSWGNGGLSQQWFTANYPGTVFISAQSNQLNDSNGFINFVRTALNNL